MSYAWGGRIMATTVYLVIKQHNCTYDSWEELISVHKTLEHATRYYNTLNGTYRIEEYTTDVVQDYYWFYEESTQ